MTALARGGAPLSLLAGIGLVQTVAGAHWLGPESAATAWFAAPGAVSATGAILLIWLLGLRRCLRQERVAGPAVAQPTAAGFIPAAPVPVAALPPGAERRTRPRFEVIHPVRVEVRGRPAVEAEIRDISEGGARIANAPALEAGTCGLLYIEGLGLPVPFEVVGHAGPGALRLRFRLEGMAQYAFLRQFDRLIGSG